MGRVLRNETKILSDLTLCASYRGFEPHRMQFCSWSVRMVGDCLFGVGGGRAGTRVEYRLQLIGDQSELKMRKKIENVGPGFRVQDIRLTACEEVFQ